MPDAARDPLAVWTSRLALALALVPVVVATVRAVADGWVPLSDAGYFTVRSRDVLTSHHPWLGAWSSGSVGLETSVRNLGPLQLDLLAPFTKLDPYAGTAVGVGLVNAASVTVVWLVVRRTLGPAWTIGVMLATLLLEASIGSVAFIDPRQQVYLLLPFWALLWLSWAMAAGDGWAVGPAVFVASLVVQTHFTYLYQALIVTAAGLAGYLLVSRGSQGRTGRWLLIGAGVGLLCWAQPLWDQIAGEGNLGATLSQRGDVDGVGFGTSAELVGNVLSPGFWLPGTLGAFRLPVDLAGGPTPWLAPLLWIAAIGLAAWLAIRAGHGRIAALGWMALVALLAAFVGAAQIPGSASFGLIPQNYYWLWPTAAFLTVAVCFGVVASVTVPRGFEPAVALSAGLALAVAASRPANNFLSDAETSVANGIGGAFLDDLAESLERHAVEGPVQIDAPAPFGMYFVYTVLAELQRAGIEFTFAPGSGDLDRFGDERCETGDAKARFFVAEGDEPVLAAGEIVLASVDGYTAADEAEQDSLDERIGQAIHDGLIEIDIEGVEVLNPDEAPRVRILMTSTGRSASGLADLLGIWSSFDLVRVHSDAVDDFDRWVELHGQAQRADIWVILAPTEPQDGGACPG